MLPTPSPSHLYGLVDMGSNGIRFSITNLHPSTARSLPTIYQDRSGISLYDAQYSTGTKGPIPQSVIDEVLIALTRFKIVCSDFGVPDTNIRILATEATRSAENSAEYRRQIREATGWEVDMLPKEAEGKIGAMGIASSFVEVDGLVMDLGGGSTQITWMHTSNGTVETSPKGSYSFPYGAAAMTQRLAEIDRKHHAEKHRQELADTMKDQFRQAYRDLDLPEILQYRAHHGGMTMYLSGGGFRGWGYLLMSQHKVSPYPIPIINGFTVSKREFQKTFEIESVASEQTVFRISKRRAAQVPAVAFLINVLIDALPHIKEIQFCQGGVREGFLFDTLPPEIRAIHPLEAATYPFSTEAEHLPFSGLGKDTPLSELLWSCLPGENTLDRSLPESFIACRSIVRAVANTMYHHTSLPKETRSLAALYFPITGTLASTHGLSHCDRAILALSLDQRWDADLPPPHDTFQTRLRQILTPQEAFWCNYLGAVASLVGHVYPAGYIREKRIEFQAEWTTGLGKKGLEQGVRLKISVPASDSPATTPDGTSNQTEKVHDQTSQDEYVNKNANRENAVFAGKITENFNHFTLGSSNNDEKLSTAIPDGSDPANDARHIKGPSDKERALSLPKSILESETKIETEDTNKSHKGNESKKIMTSPESINDYIHKIEDLGKKKNRIGGKESGFGVRIAVKIDRG